MAEHSTHLRAKPLGFTALGVFFFFGVVMSGLAAATLIWPGTSVDRIWSLNPRAHAQLAAQGRIIGVFFVLLSAALGTAGVGWFRRRLWGWRLAVTILTIQAAGDIVNLVRGDVLRGASGAIVAGAVLYYLLRPPVRSAFRGTGPRMD